MRVIQAVRRQGVLEEAESRSDTVLRSDQASLPPITMCQNPSGPQRSPDSRRSPFSRPPVLGGRAVLLSRTGGCESIGGPTHRELIGGGNCHTHQGQREPRWRWRADNRAQHRSFDSGLPALAPILGATWRSARESAATPCPRIASASRNIRSASSYLFW